MPDEKAKYENVYTAAMEPSELRASDADRRRVADELQQHYVDGRLSSDELSERMGRVQTARTYGDLDALTRDLPPLPTPAPPVEPDPARADLEEPAGPLADGSFRTHLTMYGLVMLLLVAIWLLTTPGGYFWPIWPMLGWGFGVAAHGVTRGRRSKRPADRRPRDRDRGSDGL